MQRTEVKGQDSPIEAFLAPYGDVPVTERYVPVPNRYVSVQEGYAPVQEGYAPVPYRYVDVPGGYGPGKVREYADPYYSAYGEPGSSPGAIGSETSAASGDPFVKGAWDESSNRASGVSLGADSGANGENKNQLREERFAVRVDG